MSHLLPPACPRDGEPRDAEAGFALLMVLLFLLAVTAILAPLVLGARTELLVASNQLQQQRLETIADGLLTVLARDLAAPPTEPRNEEIRVRSEPLRCRSTRYLIEARIQDQRGLIGINNAPAELLSEGFRALGFPSGDIAELTEALIAYRTRPPEDDGDGGGGGGDGNGDGNGNGDSGNGGDQADPQRVRQVAPAAGAEDRVAGGLKRLPFEAVEELYDFEGFRGKPVRALTEVFSTRNTADTILGPRISTRLSSVLPSKPTPKYPFILPDEEEGAKTYRVDVELRTVDGGMSGYAGAVLTASENDTGEFSIVERTSNPEFLPEGESGFSGLVECDMIFGAGVAAVLASDP